MNRNPVVPFLVLLLLGGSMVPPSFSQGTPIHLRGLESVTLEVAPFPAELRSRGLREHLLADSIEAQFQAAGIRIGGDKAGRLLATFKTLQARNDGFTVFQLKFQLIEPSILLRNVEAALEQQRPVETLPSLSTGLITWESTAFGYIRQYADPEGIVREAFQSKVDQFLSDWAAAQNLSAESAAGPASSTPETALKEGKRSITIRNDGEDLVIYDSLGGEVFRKGPTPPSTPLPRAPSQDSDFTRDLVPSSQDRLLRSLLQ